VQDNNVPNLFFGGAVPGNFKNSRRSAYGVLNLRAAVSAHNWSIAAFGNNVLNKNYLAEVIPAPEFGGDFISPGARAYYGVEVGFKF
jgi:iron complex outermembrane receptor protein